MTYRFINGFGTAIVLPSTLVGRLFVLVLLAFLFMLVLTLASRVGIFIVIVIIPRTGSIRVATLETLLESGERRRQPRVLTRPRFALCNTLLLRLVGLKFCLFLHGGIGAWR